MAAYPFGYPGGDGMIMDVPTFEKVRVFRNRPTEINVGVVGPSFGEVVVELGPKCRQE